MIERLVLKNFKSHGDSEIEFNPGLNIFLGEVGAGKTSILEAVSFALFGRYVGSVTHSELIRRGSEKSDISLIFSSSSGRYKVERTIQSEKTQSAKLLIYDGERWKLAVEGALAVSKSIENLLDVDSSTFLAAIYASQGETKEMLETQPGKRRERLDKLLGIDTYENIWGTLGDARNIVLNELTQAQEKASGIDVLEKQVKDLKDRRERIKEELETLKSFLKEIEDRLQPAEQQSELFEDLKQKLTQLDTRIEGKNNAIKNSSAILKSLKEKIEKAAEAENIFEKNKEFIQLERDLEKERRRIENTLQQKKNLETLLRRNTVDLQEAGKRRTRLEAQLRKLRILKEDLEALEKEREALPELNVEQAELEKKLDDAKTEAVKAFNEIENQNKKVEKVTELGECPTCLQIVPQDHKEKIRRETSKAINKLKVNYVNLEETRRQVQAWLDDLKKKIELARAADRKYASASAQVKMLEGCKDEMEEIQAKIEEIQTRIRQNIEKMAEIKDTPKTLAEITTRLKNVALKADLAREAEKQMAAKKDLHETFFQEEENFKALKLQIKELQSSKKELAEKYDPKEQEEAEKSVRLLREDRAKTTEVIGRLKNSKEEDTSQINQAEKQLENKRKTQKKVEGLKLENTILEILRRSLRDIVQPVMRKNNVLRVSDAFQGFYQELSNDNIDYAALDEEGNINVIRNGEPSPVNSLSGGETTCAALALRLAICSSLTKNQLLLLDEPTIHLDELYRAKLRDFLGSHNFEQLIVVTHDNTFDSLPAQIFRVEKRRGESVVFPLIFGGD